MKDNFKWNCYKDVKPESGRYVYVIDPTDIDDEIDIGRPSHYTWLDTYYWCYVYIPDAPRRTKLEACSTLKDCSNDYILALESRIELLEKLVQESYEESD